MIAAGVIPEIIGVLGIPHPINYELTLGIVLFLTLKLPPSYTSWKYTGTHKIVKTSNQPQRSWSRLFTSRHTL